MNSKSKTEWLEDWSPEEGKWDAKLANKTGMITTFNLGLAFATWFLASALAPKLQSLGFQFTKDELYWIAAIPGLSDRPRFCGHHSSLISCRGARSRSE